MCRTKEILFALLLFCFSCSDKNENCSVHDADPSIFYERMMDNYIDYYNGKPEAHSQAEIKVEILSQLINFNNHFVVSEADGFNIHGYLIEPCSPIRNIQTEINSLYSNDLKPLLQKLDTNDISSERFEKIIVDFFEKEKSYYSESFYELPSGIYYRLFSKMIIEAMFVDLGTNYQNS